MLFYTFFKELQESSPYIYASERCNISVCVHVLRDILDKRFTTIKSREAYVLSAKTGHFSLARKTGTTVDT
jgi:hypothetical protein